MKFDDLVGQVAQATVFRRGEILSGQANSASVERQLDRWVKSGRIIQLRRGVYALSKPYARQSPHPFLVANTMKRASYVSLQSALSYYGMIPEYVPVTTSVTTGRPETVGTPIGRFQYRHVRLPCFNGFGNVEVSPGQETLIATPEKALVDLLYLTPRSDSEAFLRELRVSPHETFIDDSVLLAAAEEVGSKKTMRAVSRLIDIWREEEA